MIHILLCVITILILCLMEILIYGALESALMQEKYASFVIGLFYMLIFVITIIEGILSIRDKIKSKSEES